MSEKLYIILLFCLLSVSATFAQEVKNVELRYQLLEMAKVDQEIRNEMIAKLQRGQTVDSLFVARQDSIDRRNRDKLKKIIDKHGWPGISLVGAEAAHAAWLIVQHSDNDLEFQKYCLKLIRNAFENGEATAQELAYLTDRVLTNEGKPQLYGTQAKIIDGEIRLAPIEDSLKVDQRRARFGLEPLNEYLKLLQQTYKSNKHNHCK